MKAALTHKPSLFSKPRRRLLLATLGVLLVSIIIVAGMPVYLPLNQANAIGLPVIFFPALWCGLFLWAVLDPKLWRASAGLFLLGIIHLAAAAFGLGII